MTDTSPLALIVDDEPDLLELLELTLSRMGVSCVSAENLAQARQALGQHRFNLCFTDMRLPDGDGLTLVREAAKQAPDMPVAVITAYGSADAAVSALKAGAFDFVAKPVELSQLRAMVRHALSLAAGGSDKTLPQSSSASPGPKPDDAHPALTRLIGDSPAMVAVREKISKLARSQAPVFVSGESGVGKELAARLIHELSPRAKAPFVAVNCGAIPSELMESEFFGHVKGAFTGASSDRAGLFRAAEGGTLFLDEIADLPLHMQVKLLRVLQEKSVRPVGGTTEVPVDVRIISASHKALADEVESGRFRQDLYYRVNVIELIMPSLRERSEDILPLARHLLERIAERWQIAPPVIDPAAAARMEQLAFPGNVRELENLLERAVTMADGNTIKAQHLERPQSPEPASGVERRPAEVDLETWLSSVEADAIREALGQAGNNKTRAAELLGISFRSLRYKISKLGLEE